MGTSSRDWTLEDWRIWLGLDETEFAACMIGGAREQWRNELRAMTQRQLRLVVTGTQDGRPDVEEALDTWVRVYGAPELVILGDARGVDEQAYGWALKRRWPARVKVVDLTVPVPTRFHRRNQAMVDAARAHDHLLAFPGPGSRGTWDCMRRGVRAGLICQEVTDAWFAALADRPVFGTV